MRLVSRKCTEMGTLKRQQKGVGKNIKLGAEFVWTEKEYVQKNEIQ